MSDTRRQDDVLKVLDAWREMARRGKLDAVPAALRVEVLTQSRREAPWSQHAKALTLYFLEKGEVMPPDAADLPEQVAATPAAIGTSRVEAGRFIGPIAMAALAAGVTYAVVELF